MPKKRRTREHIIADLSVNHVERYILSCGYSVERVQKDYGYDLLIFTYDDRGEIENGQIYVQLKATDSLKILADGATIALTLARSDLELWLSEPFPCILIVYDAREERAYWLYVQAYFQNQRGFDRDCAARTLRERATNTVNVRIPTTNIVDRHAILQFCRYKDTILKQLSGELRHET